MSGKIRQSPRVFLSYSHDSPAHELAILELSQQLRRDGVDCRIDHYTPWPEEGWPRWMEKNIQEADFVLLICTETYLRRVTGREDAGIGRGACWEASLIYNELYSAKLNSSKFLPVLMEGGDPENIPAPLRNGTYHRLSSQMGYENLYRQLTQQPRIEAQPLGELVRYGALGPKVSFGPEVESQIPTGGKQSHVFISYSHGEAQEENLARFLHAGITKAGHECFVDIGIPVGADWVSVIQDRINQCDCLLLIISEGSMKSEMVHTEIRFANLRRSRETQSHLKIIPIRAGFSGQLEYELHRYVGHLQHLFWSGTDDSQKTLEKVLSGLESDYSDETPGLPVLHCIETSNEESLRPQSVRDTRSAMIPGGTIRYDDPYYVSRLEDEIVIENAPLPGRTLVIKGPRQHGKSSVLLRYLGECQKAGKRIAFVDFQDMSQADFIDYPTFLSRLAKMILQLLAIDDELPTIESQFDMTRFILDSVLRKTKVPIVLAFDEVDRLFDCPYRADFFSMLRSWHNKRSPLSPEFENLDLALVISTEPYLLIDVADRSPFNVGLTINVESFDEQAFLRHDSYFPNVLEMSERQELWNLLGGHPYLTRLAYYRLVGPDKYSFAELYRSASEERGPFGDHLRAILFKLHEKRDLLDSFKRIIETGRETDNELYYRLYGAGLIYRGNDGRINPANILYARYFRTAL